MNTKIATLFICTFIAHIVNSTPIDSADKANLSTETTIQYEERRKALGPVLITMPPSSLASQQLGEISSEAKSEGVPTTATGSNTPQAVSHVSQPVTPPSLSSQNISNDTTPSPTTTVVPVTPVPVPVVPTTKNGTTPDTPPTTTPATTTTAPTTTSVITTTTLNPTTTTTTSPTTPTTATPSGTTTASATTTPVPTPTAAPSKDRRFDGPSFIGGIVLSLGIMAIGFVAWKFYKARTERNYHTL